MIDVSKVDRFFLYPGHVDLRKGVSTLGALVASVKVPTGEHRRETTMNRKGPKQLAPGLFIL